MAKNYCTSFPEGTWGNCCKLHDEAYDIGGCAQDRKTADRALKRCVKENSGGWLIPHMMYAAVRVFGSSHWPKSCRPKHLHWNCSHTEEV